MNWGGEVEVKVGDCDGCMGKEEQLGRENEEDKTWEGSVMLSCDHL